MAMFNLVFLLTCLFASFLHEGSAFKIIQRPTRFNEARAVNDRPIIGILSQELSSLVSGLYPSNYTSYIAASYVKFVEGAGARAVPIFINKDDAYYENIINSVNGVLLPGGAAYFNVSKGYSEAGAKLYDLAKQLNDGGDYMPVWGTCLGFELIAYLAAGKQDIRTNCDSQDVALPLHFKPDYFNSNLYRGLPQNILNTLSTRNVTANYHMYCVTEETLAATGLDQDWHVLTDNTDVNDSPFISSMESRRYPFYGVQFHPEKNGYEFKATKKIPHSREAIDIMQYFANFFIAEARKNQHKFQSALEEEGALIYNYEPTYTGDHLSFQQCYFFD